MYLRPGVKTGLFFFCAALLAGCVTPESAEKRLSPRKSTGEYRLEDIARVISEDPVKAIHLIGAYRSRYEPASSSGVSGGDGETGANRILESLEQEAVEKLRAAQSLAIEEKRWDDAASYARSLSALGIAIEKTGMEPDFILIAAKEQLEQGNDLGAFLGAVRAHELKPLELPDVLLFLERAVMVRQRRAAAFFLAAAGEAEVPEDLRRYAEGRDTVSDMIKGVATVIVDQGYRIEHGRGYPSRVLGSAFFVDASGLLITNYHVISSEVDPTYEGYSRMYIRMGDSTSPRIPAKVIGWDKAMDLALIKAESRPEYVFSVVDQVIPQVGDTVLAIGSPGGLEKTVTSGIVSALGRRFLPIGDVIQIDAAVNHGNSGGPVVDNSGRLVGIVFAGIENFPGLNFAVPAERLAAALPAMIRGGKADRPWLGLTLSETVQGAEIIYVVPVTPAEEQQVAEGVYIKALNGERVAASQGALIPALQDRLFSSRPGELVALETSDGKRRLIMTVTRPDLPLAEAAKIDTRERMAAPLFGLVLAPSLGNTFSSSFMIKKVVRGSIADEAGLSEQDPVSIRGFHLEEKEGYAMMDIDVKKRRLGYIETSMRLPAALDSPDTL
ncbi:MAG: S1C family serine protease [Treponema sp.]|jgi:S1-C subfamily serine protease|nr:S1C family serine protease [Treponema sp.]